MRNHYVGRTFIEPRQSIRSFGVRIKLNPVRHLIEGKRVVLIDDSIVRGTTSKKIVRMVREAGAREIHLRISCPPTISPCYYGIDTPNKADLIPPVPKEVLRRILPSDNPFVTDANGMIGRLNTLSGNLPRRYGWRYRSADGYKAELDGIVATATDALPINALYWRD